jgi:nitroreductase
MEFDEVVKRRKSVKNYAGKKASWESVLEAVDAAIKGPFASNNNNLHFLIVEDESTIANIAESAEQLWIGDVGLVVVICSDDRNLENIYGERGRVYSRQQAGAAIGTFLLKLVDNGLSGCWVGAYDDNEIRDLLGIPRHVHVEAIVPVGYAERRKVKEVKRKRALESVLFWEKWNGDRRPTGFEEGREDIKMGSK